MISRYIRMRAKIMKFSRYFLTALFLTSMGCARSHSSPGPCQVGLNASQCDLDVKEHSQWVTNSTTSQVDEKTQKPVPGTERRIEVKYEFAAIDDIPAWRRTMVIRSDSDTISMFQEGVVSRIDHNSIDLSPRVTSCDDSPVHLVPTDFKLYYSRIGDTLQFDTSPIIPQRPGLMGALVSGFSEVLIDTIEGVFTLGSARTLLTSGRGHFSAVKPVAQAASEVDAEDLGRIGCFSVLGSGFSESKIKPSW
jgi:hypothetical protein